MTLCHPGLQRHKRKADIQRVAHWITGQFLCTYNMYTPCLDLFQKVTSTFPLHHIAALHPGLFYATMGVSVSLSRLQYYLAKWRFLEVFIHQGMMNRDFVVILVDNSFCISIVNTI